MLFEVGVVAALSVQAGGANHATAVECVEMFPGAVASLVRYLMRHFMPRPSSRCALLGSSLPFLNAIRWLLTHKP